MTQPPPPSGPPLPHAGPIPTPQGWIPPQPVHIPRAQRPPLTAGPLPFHRLYRGLAGFAWWRPLIAIGVGAATYMVTSVFFVLALVAVGVAVGQLDLGGTPQEANDALNELVQIDAASPLSLILALGSIALMLPSAVIGQLAAGLRPLGVRHSVAFRIRWRVFFASLLPSFSVVAAALLIPLAISAVTGEAPIGPMTTDPALFALCVVIILVITPFQAAAEEYVFRGLLVQTIGAWIRFAPVGWIATTIVFVSGHLYDIWGLLSVAVFALGASIIVYRTGGLEAAIALHSVNNIASFIVLASGVQGTTVNPTSGSTDFGVNLSSIGIALLTTAVWVFWVDRWAQRRKLATLGGMLPPAGVHNSIDPAPAASAEA